MTFVLHAQQLPPIVGRRGRVLDVRPCVYRLVLARTSLLYPYSTGRVEWVNDQLRLDAGVYLVGSRYLVVEGDAGTYVTEAAALARLGAGTELSALGLGDAAISLSLGDLTNARYQWLRHRDGR
jgi:hypothetical protein